MASGEQSEFPAHYTVKLFFVAVAALIALVIVISTMVILQITDPNAEEKALLRELHARSLALEYARSNTFDLFTAFKPRLSNPDALSAKSQLQRTYNLFYRQVSVYPADDHPLKHRRITGAMEVPLIVRLEPDNRRETIVTTPEHLVWVLVMKKSGRPLEGLSITLAED